MPTRLCVELGRNIERFLDQPVRWKPNVNIGTSDSYKLALTVGCR